MSVTVPAFGFARTPRILFGVRARGQLGRILAGYGGPPLFVTGRASYAGPAWDAAIAEVRKAGTDCVHVHVDGEPTPELVDAAVAAHADRGVRVVVAWGGGSVVDAGKAISAMLPRREPVAEYLEDVGNKELPDGAKIPFVAVPTTAGTGSEATKNAVLSRVGPDGFKKSLRHDGLVPDVALVDPELALTCPPHVTAACGMDAFTQLLEAYVSIKASPMTDALAISGLDHVIRGLPRAFQEGSHDIEARTGMAYAALVSGIVLANAGLGVVHGLASPIGARFDAPHGAVCGALVAAATSATIRRLFDEGRRDHPALIKYARVGALFSDRAREATETGCAVLIEALENWTEMLAMPRLTRFGIAESDLPGFVAGASNKNNPVPLTDGEIAALLRACL